MLDMKMCPYCMRVSFGDFCRECGKTKSYVDEDMKLPVGSFLEGYHSYQIGAALGQGGFGVTYIALDLDTNQRVAVKEFFPVYCAGRTKTATVAPFSGQQELYEKGKERFLQEVQTMQLLENLKSVVNVYDCFEANGTIYLVMEYVEGQSLKQWVMEHGPIEPERLFHLVRPLMEDIAAMHKEGVIHRDIAPDNIIMDREGNLRLIDFGIARDFAGEKSMTVMVKKGFAPLEQYTRNGQNAATDVYALAATFYYCLTGQTTPDAMDRLTKDELKKPSELGVQLTKRQEKALIHALGVLTKDRTQSVSAMIKELYPPVKPAKQKEPENLETVQYTQKKSASPKGWIAAAVVLLVLTGAFGAWKLTAKTSELQSSTAESIQTDKIAETAEEAVLNSKKENVVYAYSDDPADNSTYTAEEFAEIVNSENVRELLPIGTRIKMVPNSKEITDESIEFELVAYKHYQLADGEDMAKTTWLAVNTLNESRRMNAGDVNDGGWSKTELRGWLNETLYPSLPDYWKDLIQPAQVISTLGNCSDKTITSMDYLFLPSLGEVNSYYVTKVSSGKEYYQSEIAPTAEEQTFSVFTDDSSRAKHQKEEISDWWLRSPDDDSTSFFRHIGYDGITNYTGSLIASFPAGVVPCFCLGGGSQKSAAASVRSIADYDYAYSDDPADNAMYTAEEFAEIVKSENVRELLPIGTRIKMVPNSKEITDESIEFELVAYQHFKKINSTEMAKTTWLAVNVLNEPRKMKNVNSNKGGWSGSALHGWLNETLYPTFPKYWKDLIARIQVSSTAGNHSQDIVNRAGYLFIPSLEEVDSSYDSNGFYKDEISPEAEERTFPVFSDMASRVKYRNGQPVVWWLRSPWVGSSNNFAFVYSSGNVSTNTANNSYGVCPGFCI